MGGKEKSVGKRRMLETVSLSFACSYHSYLSLHQRGVGFSGNIESCIARQNTSGFKIGISERKYQPNFIGVLTPVAVVGLFRVGLKVLIPTIRKRILLDA